MRKPKPPRCKCGETGPENFYPKRKSICRRCYNAVRLGRYKHFSAERKRHAVLQASQWQDTNILRYRLNAAQHRADKAGMLCTISLQDLHDIWEKQQGLCYYTKKPMRLVRDRVNSVSLDRRNNDLGYTPENVVLCLSAVNIMKQEMSVKEFAYMVETLYLNMPGE